MKPFSLTTFKNLCLIQIVICFFSCASVPSGTARLSEKLGEDLTVVHKAHLALVELHFQDIKNNINSFIDETYAPFIINYVLKKEYSSYQSQQPSIFTSLNEATNSTEKSGTDKVVQDMQDFLNAAKKQIEQKRSSLIDPVNQQETEVRTAVNNAYMNMMTTNNAITNYLQSIQKLKASQSDALSKAGIAGADSLLTKNLSSLSSEINRLVQKGNQINVKSDGALSEIEKITSEIKTLIK